MAQVRGVMAASTSSMDTCCPSPTSTTLPPAARMAKLTELLRSRITMNSLRSCVLSGSCANSSGSGWRTMHTALAMSMPAAVPAVTNAASLPVMRAISRPTASRRSSMCT